MWLFIGTKFHNINILVVVYKRGGLNSRSQFQAACSNIDQCDSTARRRSSDRHTSRYTKGACEKSFTGKLTLSTYF